MRPRPQNRGAISSLLESPTHWPADRYVTLWLEGGLLFLHYGLSKTVPNCFAQPFVHQTVLDCPKPVRNVKQPFCRCLCNRQCAEVLAKWVSPPHPLIHMAPGWRREGGAR